MPHYPLFLSLENHSCLVFGGGEVALRKVRSLLGAGAHVTCASREFCGPLKRLAGPQLHLKKIRGSQVPLGNARLVIAATSSRDFNLRVAKACRKKKVWVNVVDDPELCDFYVPAVLKRGPLQIAISTDGASPFFAKRLREELERAIPVSTGQVLERIGKIRNKMRARAGRKS